MFFDGISQKYQRPLVSIFFIAPIFYIIAPSPLLAQQATCTASPADITDKRQREVVDTVAPSFAQQARSYPMAPHLVPSKVAEAMKSGENKNKFTFVIAHRGDHMEPGYAENGLSGIWRAYQSGADGVELDIKTDCAGHTVLGHDFSTGRELSTAGWSTDQYYPATDPQYNNEGVWPFRADKLKSGKLNLNRYKINYADIWDKPINDQLMNKTYFSEGQITAYQAMYAVAKYWPMMIWFDVKSLDDLKITAKEIEKARNDLKREDLKHSKENGYRYKSDALEYIGLKITPVTLRDSNFNPSKATNVSNLLYFLVVGTGDFGTITNDGKDDIVSEIKKYCNLGNGCVGIEVNHKYEGAPTQGLFDAIKKSDNFRGTQLASFHTLPQYDWYNIENQNRKYMADVIVENFHRTFPRTDGTCCFALEDALNFFKGDGEILDRRAAYKFNAENFDAITTDDNINMLRILMKNGKRDPSFVKKFGAEDKLPSGGGVDWWDGLYWITALSAPQYSLDSECLLTEKNDTLSCVPIGRESLSKKEAIWSVTARDREHVQITNIADGRLMRADLGKTEGDRFVLVNNEQINLDNTLFSLKDFKQNGTAPNWTLIDRRANVSRSYRFYKVQQPFLESNVAKAQVENRYGPPGASFICDEGGIDCNPLYRTSDTYRERLYFGVGPYSWVTKDISTNSIGMFDCTSGWFGKDPAPGQRKACYRSIIYEFPRSSSSGAVDESSQIEAFKYNHSSEENYASEGKKLPYGNSLLPRAGALYGEISADSDGKSASLRGAYIPQDLHSDGMCATPKGMIDPLPGKRKKCFIIYTGESTKDIEHDADYFNFHFTPCNEFCFFTIPHIVALKYYGSDDILRITYKTFSTGVRCDARLFGVQSNNKPVSCFARPVLSTVRNVPNFSWCADEGGTCFVKLSKVGGAEKVVVAYASPNSKSNVIYKLISDNIVCDNKTFGEDPDIGTKKSCFYKLY